MRTRNVMASFLIGLLFIAGACSPAPATPAPATSVTRTGPAAFTVNNLSIYPQLPSPRGYAMVIVDVTNTGGESGTYMVDVKVDGTTVATQNVTLAGGTSQTVKTGFDVGTIGTYKVSVGNLSIDMLIVAKMYSDQ